MVKKAQDRYRELFELLGKIDDRAADLRCYGSSRQDPFPVFRAMVWKRMRDEGYTTRKISEVAGRGTSGIILTTNSIEGNFSGVSPRAVTLRKVWREFNAACDGIQAPVTEFCREWVADTLDRALVCGKITDTQHRYLQKELGI